MNNNKTTIRIAIALIAITISYFVSKKDIATNQDTTPNIEFTRSNNTPSTVTEQSPDSVIPLATNATEQQVIELHNQALNELDAKNYQQAYELMLQVFELDKNPQATIRINASRVAGHRASQLQRLYKNSQALTVWHQAVAFDHDGGHPQLSLAKLLLQSAAITEALEVVTAALDEFPQHVQLLALRGEIASLRGDHQLAQEMLRAAADLDPDNEVIAQRLAQLELEALAFAEYLTASTAHFESSFDANNRSMVRNIDDLQQDLENAWQDISGLLGINNQRRIVVLWIDTNDYQGQVPDWSSGVYDGRIRIVVNDYPERRPQLLATLKHELTHALLHSTGLKLPTFVQEGLAQLYEPRKVAPIRDNYLDAELPQLLDLQGSWMGWDDIEKVRLAYAYSLSLCDFVVERYGKNSFSLLFENMRQQDFSAAWTATFGLSLEDVDELHRKFLGQ